jgi:hypothetical protein
VARRWIVSALLLAMVIGAPVLRAQFPRPLSPLPEQGNRVAPFFDGWYDNPDGTISLSFGFSNLNKSTVEIPLGPDNFITPKEFDGRQPTSFPPATPERDGGANAGIARAADPAPATGAADPNAASSGAAATPPPDAAGGGRGRGRGGPAGGDNRYDRERGAFTVTVPKNFQGDVVWTLRYRGQTYSVPGRAKSSAYQLSWPMAMGSTPPLLRFQPTGQAGRGPMGIQGPELKAKVGVPLELTVFLTDDAVHEKEPISIKREAVPPMNATWYKHSGPAEAVTFEPPKQPIAEAQGKATTKATFKEPGQYVVRVRGDTFGNIDSTAADQCCWTNGYWKVEVTR